MNNKPTMVDGYWWILPVNKESVDFSSIEKYANENNFQPKEEMHITIIGSAARDAIVDAISKLDNEGKQKLLENIEALMSKYDWDFQATGFYHIKKMHESVEKESIVSPVEMPSIELFYSDLNALLNTNLPAQFPHITFYTKGPKNKDGYFGIPLPSEEIFKESIFKKLWRDPETSSG